MSLSPPVSAGISQSKQETAASAEKVRVEEWQWVATLGWVKQLGWVPESDNLLKSCWVKESKYTLVFKTTSWFKERWLSSEVVRSPLCFPKSLVYIPCRTSRHVFSWRFFFSFFLRETAELEVPKIIRCYFCLLFTFFLFQVYFDTICTKGNNDSDRRPNGKVCLKLSVSFHHKQGPHIYA